MYELVPERQKRKYRLEKKFVNLPIPEAELCSPAEYTMKEIVRRGSTVFDGPGTPSQIGLEWWLFEA